MKKDLNCYTNNIYKMFNNLYQKVNIQNMIITESWRKTRARLKEQYPNTEIKYSYKTKQFTIVYDLPSDFSSIVKIDFIKE